MTDKEKLDKLVAEIERRKKMNILNENKYEEDIDLLSFIDSMQKEPKDRCRGCNNVKGCITCVDGSEYAHIEECNITGIKSKHAIGKLKECIDNITEEGLEEARKQLEELTKECMYSKDNYTDKDRKALCDGCEEKCRFNKKEEPVSEDLEEFALQYAGHHAPYDSCWQEVEDAVKAGAKWQKEQMIAKAVEVTVHINAGGYPYIPQLELYDYDNDIPLAKEGDKYKVVLIKEN